MENQTYEKKNTIILVCSSISGLNSRGFRGSSSAVTDKTRWNVSVSGEVKVREGVDGLE